MLPTRSKPYSLVIALLDSVVCSHRLASEDVPSFGVLDIRFKTSSPAGGCSRCRVVRSRYCIRIASSPEAGCFPTTRLLQPLHRGRLSKHCNKHRLIVLRRSLNRARRSSVACHKAINHTSMGLSIWYVHLKQIFTIITAATSSPYPILMK